MIKKESELNGCRQQILSVKQLISGLFRKNYKKQEERKGGGEVKRKWGNGNGNRFL